MKVDFVKLTLYLLLFYFPYAFVCLLALIFYYLVWDKNGSDDYWKSNKDDHNKRIKFVLKIYYKMVDVITILKDNSIIRMKVFLKLQQH